MDYELLSTLRRHHPAWRLLAADNAPFVIGFLYDCFTFRVAVTDAYGRACAATGEHSLPALEAAHIRPYTQDGPHDVPNGLLLRADLHRLFDQGYMTVTPDLRVRVGRRLREDYENGKTYYPLDNSPLNVPRSNVDQPSREYLAWHNEHVFRG